MSESEESVALPETKKRRTGDVKSESSGAEPEAITITRAPDLWFDDGNIVLQAEKTQFRVHRGHISSHSSIFKDMFMMPQPEGEATVEGCPVIHIPDRAQDWENLLMAMYNVFKTHRLQKDYPVCRALSLLHLGNKYHLDFFRDIGADCLRTALPITLEEWDCSTVHIPDVEVDEVDVEPYTMSYEFDLVNTALEVGLRSILPALYFVCLRDRTTTEIFEGSIRGDGTVAKLPAHVQKALMGARDRIIRRAINETILEPLEKFEKADNLGKVKCASIGACFSRSKAADERMILLALHPGAALQIAEKLRKCDPCNKFCEQQINQGRRAIWERLPAYFGLPGWTEAKDFDA